MMESNFLKDLYRVFTLMLLLIITYQIMSIRHDLKETPIIEKTNVEEIEPFHPITILKPIETEVKYENSLKAILTKNQNSFLCPFCETHLVVWASHGEGAVARYQCPNCEFHSFEVEVNVPSEDAAIEKLDRLLIKYCSDEGEDSLWD